MKKKSIIFSLLLAFLLMGAGENQQQQPHEPSHKSQSDSTILFFLGGALGTAFVAIVANGVSQLLSSGANQQILDQVAKSLAPIQASLHELNQRNNEFDKTLNSFNITLISISNRADADRVLFKSEITNMGDRLEHRIVLLENHNVQRDRQLEKNSEDINQLKLNRKTSNE